MMSFPEIQNIVANLSIGDMHFLIKKDGDRPYLQVYCVDGVDTKTGNKTSWTSRKWMLSYHMCVTEIVRTAYKAYITALEHEAAEVFKYKGQPIYSPHFDVEKLFAVCESSEFEDSRPNGMSGI